LSDHQQFVIVNDLLSTLLSIPLGILPGSIPSPLLFLFYKNYLRQGSNLLSFLFADDTTLMGSDSNLAIFACVNAGFRKVE
jgi:hypothetical protein